MLQEGKISDIETASCGIAGSSLLNVPPEVKSILQEKGCDVSGHVSQPLDQKALSQAHLILVMEGYHRETIQRFYPEAAPRTYLLKEYVGESPPHEISDPIGTTEENYRKTASLIEDCMRKLLEKLKIEK